MVQASDDRIAITDHPLLMHAALRAAGVPVEMHLFERGGHGFGLGVPGSPVSAWPSLFMAWMRGTGCSSPDGRPYPRAARFRLRLSSEAAALADNDRATVRPTPLGDDGIAARAADHCSAHDPRSLEKTARSWSRASDST